ncbi:MAG: phosphoribosylglycinamide formyltransferase [Phaeodactylibacter xiamenensis]|jgi:phosphoribosylglycinamide formyltransferase-1|uniref:Phosphoribosylglycinamide formyltransferase n=1 Tax=Phaeodactylibacter xiamenensis TaxID=1524460 RepID=A0A098S8W8_9BACT|nr:phosphoribosylglycinamide formyltransferase [Phaeodactylibacter xiamenensis]KGE88989.1 phosphoribosylglycinamide formyltransferase [Phaeodactylibacter xiamenensis]MCR9052344.1 phosphoribosylglycinamide formyltransferase [bacterium]
MERIAIFASGTGSNAKKIIEYFRAHPNIEVGLVVANKPDAPVLAMAEELGIETLRINRSGFYQSEGLLAQLTGAGITFIVLAGFLWLVPAYLVNAYRGRMVNIHPALLPKFGGKGMYGMHVHRAVRNAGEPETGITIHLVNEAYDEGDALYQAKCSVEPSDTPEQIAGKVHQLEHEHFAPVIEKYIKALNS